MTSVSSTSSATGTNTTSSVVSSAANQILTSLGTGSGIDTASLITQLVAANKASKQDAITSRQNANTAKISALATVKNGVDSLTSALQSLVGSGQLMTTPTSSDSSVVTASAISGEHVGDLSASLEVVQLAYAQTLESAAVTDPSAPIGQGTMTLTTASGTATITIDGSNDSLSGLATAINGAKAGVTASVVQDGTGYRLVLKGATGAANGFTLTADAGAAAGLSSYAYDGSGGAGLSEVQAAQDAIVKLDGVSVSRASNTIDDLVPGTEIALKRAGTVALGATRPTEAITQAVNDFVTAYNSLKSVIDQTTVAATSTSDAGALNGNSAIRQIQTMLSKLTSTTLSTYGSVSTLTEIGVATNRDGTLTLDTGKLNAVLDADPDGVEALFNPGQRSSSPLVSITSALGATPPGTYTLTGVTPQSGSTAASGTIDGTAALGSGSTLSAAYGTPPYGLKLKVTGAVSSMTITIDLGLTGAMAAIQKSIEGTTGLITTLQASLNTTAGQIADDQAKLDSDSTAYQAQLQTQFTSMQSAVTSYKSIQSYLTQQVALWTKSD